MIEIHELVIEARIVGGGSSARTGGLAQHAEASERMQTLEMEQLMERFKREVTHQVMSEVRQMLLEERGNKT